MKSKDVQRGISAPSSPVTDAPSDPALTLYWLNHDELASA